MRTVRRWRRCGFTTLVAAAAIAGPVAPTALAYVQSQVTDPVTHKPTGVRIHWSQSCVPLTVYPNDLAEMTADQVLQATAAAAAVWSKGALPCTYFDIQVTASTEPTVPAGLDAYNVVVFRDPWCDPAHPEECQPEALAVTSAYSGTRTGIIRTGDIEVNAEAPLWGDLVAQPGLGKRDLQNALAHEMGHLVGLDHNCYKPPGDHFQQTDQTGALVANCLSASAEVQAGTMFATAEIDDVSKRSLEPDDQAGVCAIYPAADDPHYCPPAGTVIMPGGGGGGGGCSCRASRDGDGAGGGDGDTKVVLSLSILAFAGLARRGRVRRRGSVP